jgi:peptide/nickel transport system permease protein/oligopeptide transport system permease protein
MTDMGAAVAAESPPQAPATSTAGPGGGDKPRSLFNDAIRDLRRNPIFWIAVVLSLIVIAMGVVPGLFTPNDPQACQLSRQFGPAQGWAIFGYDFQGCDVYARAVHGASASLKCGFFGVLLAAIFAVLIGLPAGYFGGWIDAVLSRITDIVLGVPYLLAGIVLAKRLTADAGGENPGVTPVVLVLGLLGWTQAARVIRSSVISSKSQDYVSAAKMLGAGHVRIMWRHILPNSLAPVIVVLTIALGIFIASEATLSFLGIGLRPPTISWGIDISTSQRYFRTEALPLLVPAGFLAVTVLAFIMLGDAIRDAFDPRLR